MLLSVRQGDAAAFDRNWAQLSVYYGDARGLVAPSPREAALTALHLLSLLVQSRIGQFHTQLEVVPPEVQASPEVAQVRERAAAAAEPLLPRVLCAVCVACAWVGGAAATVAWAAGGTSASPLP